VEDFKYSEQPILCTISENLADVYQALRNLLEIFRSNYEDAMQVALYDTVEEFKLYWGQTLLNALKALHDVRFSVKD
jgi:nitrate/nitrite-specific signal transduction histidine kinase